MAETTTATDVTVAWRSNPDRSSLARTLIIGKDFIRPSHPLIWRDP